MDLTFDQIYEMCREGVRRAVIEKIEEVHVQFDPKFLAGMVREVWARNTPPIPAYEGYVYAQIPVPSELTIGDIPRLEEASKVEIALRENGQACLIFWKLVQPPRLPIPEEDPSN